MIRGLHPELRAEAEAVAAVAEFVVADRENRRLAAEYVYPGNRLASRQLWETCSRFREQTHTSAYLRRNKVFGVDGLDLKSIVPPANIHHLLGLLSIRFSQYAETRPAPYRALIFTEVLERRAYLLSPPDAKSVSRCLKRTEGRMEKL